MLQFPAKMSLSSDIGSFYTTNPSVELQENQKYLGWEFQPVTLSVQACCSCNNDSRKKQTMYRNKVCWQRRQSEDWTNEECSYAERNTQHFKAHLELKLFLCVTLNKLPSFVTGGMEIKSPYAIYPYLSESLVMWSIHSECVNKISPAHDHVLKQLILLCGFFSLLNYLIYFCRLISYQETSIWNVLFYKAAEEPQEKHQSH